MVKTEFVVIARLLRPQGRRGEILADLLTDFPEKFAERRQLWISSGRDGSRRELQLESFWMHKGRIVLKFSGIDSISDAEPLAGMLVEIPHSQRASLDSGSFYVADLVGCTVVEVSFAPSNIGTIEEVEQGAGSAPILIVRQASRQHEIPFATEYIVRFDPDRRVLEMKLPVGLLEINASLSQEEKQQQADKPSTRRTRI